MEIHLLPTDPVALGLTADGVTRLCDEALSRAQMEIDRIVALVDADTTLLDWNQTFGTFDDIAHALQEAASVPQLLSMAHPDKAVRDAAALCEPKVSAFASGLLMNDAVAGVLKRAAGALQDPDPIHQRFMEETLRDYRRNGLELPLEKRDALRTLNEKITDVGQQFDRNLAETSLSINITPDQLEGLPASYITAHPVDEKGLVRVSTDYPDAVPFLRYAKDRTAARRLYTLSQNRAVDKNLPLLDTLIRLRNEKKDLLGYPTWADYVLEPRMAKTAAVVKSFLEDLHHSLKPKREEEFKAYQDEAATLGLTTEQGAVSASDSAYLEDRICAKKFSLDSQRLSEFFEVRAVEQGIFDIAATLYGISFRPVPHAPTWHEDVRAIDVCNADGSAVIGRAYLDLYPREGKYKHAAVFTLRQTMKLVDGSRLLPIASLVCNFPKPGASPALLSHEEVVTFFHEFGHLLHDLLSESPLASFAGTSVARDFVEAPSQMFEEWAWSRITLDRFARHYATQERIPEDLFQAMTAARTFGEAIHTERQLFLAALDQAYHTRAPGFDTTAVMEELYPEFSSFTRIPDTHFQATFGHLIGYDAAYYGYQWALSIAFDLLTRFQAEGLMNRKTADDYRNAILARGGTVEEGKMVERFLGRPANSDAYKHYLGITT